MTLNRLCASGLEAVGAAARAIRADEMTLALAGGVESMTRAPFVIGKADGAFGRGQKLEDTTMGWRFVNPALDALYGTEPMPRTGENVAVDYAVSRADQDAFALRSQQRAVAAQQSGYHAQEIVAVTVPGRKKGETTDVAVDEHPRADSSIETLQKLKPLFGPDGTVHRGQRIGDQRRRRRDDRRQRGRREGTRAGAARENTRHGVGGSRAARDGDRPGGPRRGS